jgi:hypothetical protein
MASSSDNRQREAGAQAIEASNGASPRWHFDEKGHDDEQL